MMISSYRVCTTIIAVCYCAYLLVHAFTETTIDTFKLTHSLHDIVITVVITIAVELYLYAFLAINYDGLSDPQIVSIIVSTISVIFTIAGLPVISATMMATHHTIFIINEAATSRPPLLIVMARLTQYGATLAMYLAMDDLLSEGYVFTNHDLKAVKFMLLMESTQAFNLTSALIEWKALEPHVVLVLPHQPLLMVMNIALWLVYRIGGPAMMIMQFSGPSIGFNMIMASLLLLQVAWLCYLTYILII